MANNTVMGMFTSWGLMGSLEYMAQGQTGLENFL